MLMRTGMAEGSGEPIPDDSPPGVLPKIGRSIARSERERVPLYQRSWQVLLAVALVLLIAAGWAIAASVIGPFPAIVAVGIAAWIILILYVRASQKSLTTRTPSGESWDLVMAPRGVPLVSLTNQHKTWLHTPGWVIDHNLQHFGEWEVSVEHKVNTGHWRGPTLRSCRHGLMLPTDLGSWLESSRAASFLRCLGSHRGPRAGGAGGLRARTF